MKLQRKQLYDMAKKIAEGAEVMDVPSIVWHYEHSKPEEREAFDNFVVLTKDELVGLVFELLKSAVGANDALEDVRALVKRYGYDDTDYSLTPAERSFIKRYRK